MAYYSQTNRQTERVNQKLEQYLRVFINHRQKQQLDWLETAKFIYNNKIHSAIQMLPFKANYGQNPRIEFEEKRKRKYKVVERFAKRIKKI